MKQLGKVLNKTSWAQASNTINTNSESVFSAVTMLENAAFKHKGYFLTSEEVEQLYPSAEEGSQAFVYNSSNPSTAPYDIYQMIGGTWVDTGLNGGSVSVDLTKKQDTLVGYSESVSGGKATQVAIQGDTIALSGKVSLGNVDDIESAILMSSSQAGAAIAKANTLEQSMNAIKSPVKPIHLNSQGKLELNIGKGLYVENGKLCTTGASGGGGGGATLSEGAGISILNNKISVAYNTKTLGIDSCGGLTVNYGEGLTIKNGKLSAQASVNAGNGLVKKGDALQVSVGTGLLVADDVYVNMGKGLATDNENKVNVNLDEQTLTTDACGKVIVNKDSLIGNGLKQEYSKLAVNYGTGLALSNKAIVVNYGTGLSIQDGKLVSTVSSGKTYVSGQAININGNEINVKYDGVTISTKDSTDKSLHVMLGSGLKQGTSGIDVAVGSGLAIGSDNKIYATGSGGGSTYTEGDGITLNGSKISVKFGDGLKIQNKSLTIATGDGIHIKSGSIAINPSNGLGFTTDGMLSLKLHEKSGLKVNSEGLGVNAGVALGTADGKLNVQYGTGLGKGSDNKLEVLIGTGLALDGNYIKIADAEYTQIEAVDGKQDKLLGYSESKNGDNTLNVNVTASHVGIKGTTDITITSPALNLRNVTRINDAVFSGMQTKGDINLNAKSVISASIDPGELKVLHRGSTYGFIARTVDNPSDPYGLMLVELLSTDGYSSYKYTFPAKSGDVALKSDLSSKQNTLTYGTGINISGDTITVNYGTGLSVSGGKLYSTVQSKTYVSGQAININGNEINVKYDGVTISTKDSTDKSLHVMLGSGLKQGTSGIDVAVGSGLAIGEDNKLYSTVSSGKTYTAGDGIDISGNKIAVLYGSGLTTNKCGKLIVDAANLTVGYADYAYYAPTSCSAQYASYAESADHAAVSCSASYASSAGKATADANGNNIADTYLKSVGASGDGISISGGKIAVKYRDGLKIVNGSLTIATGDGLHIKDNTLAINPSFGLGFTTDGMLKLKLQEKSGLQETSAGLGVNTGVALGTSDGKLNVQYGTGLGKSTDNKLQVLLGTGLAVEGNYIRVEEAVYDSIEEANAGVDRAHEVVTKLQTALGGKQNTLTLATGLEWGKTDMIQVKMNAPLNYDEGGRLKLNYDSTLTVSNNKLGVDLYGVMDDGGGLFIKNTGLAVNVGRGLKIDSCQVVVDYGTGMSENNNKIYVDTSKIAGIGIDLDSAYKTLTIGTKAAKELAGTGLAADGPKIKVKYGSGLTTNSCGGLIVDAANLTVGNASKLDGASKGYNNGNIATYVSFPGISSLISQGYLRSDYESIGYPNEDFLKAICKWAIATYPNTGEILMGRVAPSDSGFLILSMYSASGYHATSLLPRYCTGWYMSLIGRSYRFSTVEYVWSMREMAETGGIVYGAVADANGNTITTTYAKQFSPTNGLAMNNDRVLYLPNLTSTLAGNAVDGSKNGAQRVLNLSCGAIQIKLSTGLAIDDGGYLYIQDKYVTK